MAGEVTVLGPYDVGSAGEAAIIAGLSGTVVVADDITAYTEEGQVYFTVIHA